MNSAREALLAAARVCESLWDEHDKARAELHSSYHEGAADAAEECERRILALAEQQPAESMPHHASLWATVRTLAEGSDWKRDSGESLEQWAIRRIQRGAAARELPAVKSASRQHEGKADQHSHVTRDDPVHADAPPALVPVRDSAKQPAQSAPHPDPAGQEGCGLQGSKGFVPTVEQGQPALPGPETVRVPREPTNAMIDAPRQIILYAETPGRTLEGLRAHLERSGVDYLAWFPVWATRECGHLTKAGIAILVYRAMLAAGSANSKEQR